MTGRRFGMGRLSGMDPRVKLACLLAFVVAALHAGTPAALALCSAAAFGAALATRMGWRDVRRVMRPLAAILVLTAVMQVLYYQDGAAVFQIGPVAVTWRACAQTARMLVGLVCIMVASVAFMRCTPTEGLTRTLRWLFGPLRAVGAKTDALMFSLSVAFRFVPVLADEFAQLKRAQTARMASFGGPVRKRVGAYMKLFPPLVRSAFRRADSLAEAAVSRCLSCGLEPTSLKGLRAKASDAAALCLCICLCTAIAVLG